MTVVSGEDREERQGLDVERAADPLWDPPVNLSLHDRWIHDPAAATRRGRLTEPMVSRLQSLRG